MAVFDCLDKLLEFLAQSLCLGFKPFRITARIEMRLIAFKQFSPFARQRGQRAKTLGLRGERNPGLLHQGEPGRENLAPLGKFGDLAADALKPRGDVLLLCLDLGFVADVLGKLVVQRHQVIGQQASPGITHVQLDGLRSAGNLRLAAQGRQLPADLGVQVFQPVHVALHGLQLAQGLFLAPPVLEHPGGFLDEAPAVFGSGMEDSVQLALADDDMHFTAQPRVGQEFLDVQQPARASVDCVFGAACTEQGS